jgi:hypothetical protein
MKQFRLLHFPAFFVNGRQRKRIFGLRICTTLYPIVSGWAYVWKKLRSAHPTFDGEELDSAGNNALVLALACLALCEVVSRLRLRNDALETLTESVQHVIALKIKLLEKRVAILL